MDQEENTPLSGAALDRGSKHCWSSVTSLNTPLKADFPNVSTSNGNYYSGAVNEDFSIDVHSDSELIFTPPKAKALFEEICEEIYSNSTATGGQRRRRKPVSSSRLSCDRLGKQERCTYDCYNGTTHAYTKVEEETNRCQDFTSHYARKSSYRRFLLNLNDELIHLRSKSSGTRWRGSGEDATTTDNKYQDINEEEELLVESRRRLRTMEQDQQDTKVATTGLSEEQLQDKDRYRFSHWVQQKECVIKLLKLSLHLLESSQREYFPFDSLVSLIEKDSKVESERVEEKHNRELLQIKEDHKKDIIDLQDRMLKWMCSRIDVVHQQENTIHQLDRELENARSMCLKLKERPSSRLANKGTQWTLPIEKNATGPGCGIAEASSSKWINDNGRIRSSNDEGVSPLDAECKEKEVTTSARSVSGNTMIAPQHQNAIYSEQESVVSRLTIYDTATAEKLFKDICYKTTRRSESKLMHHVEKVQGTTEEDGILEDEFVDALSNDMI